MIEQIIDPQIHDGILVDLLLNKEVPYTETLALVGLLPALCKIIPRTSVSEIVMHIIPIVCNGIAVEHV